jgi:aspartate carbamoyltransferase catalytic subunit
MGADAVILRHSASGAARRLAEWTEGSVINAGDGTHEHPTQALLDAFTIRKHLKASSENNAGLGLDLSGVKVAIVGDILHSRVARSNVLLLSLLGAKVTLVAPPTLLPVGVSDWPADISYDFDSAIRNTDVVMMLRLQLERMKSAFFPSAREYSRLFGLDSERLAKGENSPLILHPGPINRGLEISSECADNADSLILEQVKNGVSVRMAVLYLLLGGAD